MRLKLLATAAASVLLAALTPTVAQADHSWGSYHWARQANPFTLKLGDNVGSTWDPYLTGASSDWSASSVLDTTVVAGGTRPRNCRATTGRAEVCNASYGSTGWLGVAQIWVSGGTHITAGVVKVNDTYFNTATYNTPAWRALVMCQEVGHVFGLDHQDENFDNPNLGTCMDYTSNPSTNQHPNAHDYQQLESIYAHLDSTTTVDQAAPAGGTVASGNAWGRLVQGSRAAGHSTYVRRDSNGDLLVTFVTWA